MALRVRQFAVDRSLWVDEALLAHNVLTRDLGRLLDPLGGQQGAPVGYLWLLRAIVVGVGEDEQWMRLPSLVAGVAVLVLVWALARRLLGPRVAAVAVALAAVSPGLIRYSVELKQYSLDAAIALGLVLLAVRADVLPRRGRLVVVALAGTAAIWFSHPAVLVLAGVGPVLLVRRVRAGDRRGVGALVAVGAAWLASFGALYLVSLRQLTDNEFLTDYWRAGFPESLRPDRWLGWASSATVDLLDDIGGFAFPVLAAIALVVAVAAIVARKRGVAVAWLLAFAPPLLLAATLEQYPYRDRLALFALPPLLVLLAGLVEVVELRGRVVGGAALVALAVLGAGPAVQSARRLVDPLRFPESRLVIAYLAAHQHPGDRIFLHGLADAPFSIYGARAGLSADARLGWRRAAACDGPPALAAQTGTIWVVFAYTHSAAPPDEASILRSHLATVGHRLDLFEAYDAFVARYDLDAPPDDPTGSSQRVTPFTGCLRVLPA